MISFSHKFLFLDITKTGGSAICKALKRFGGQGKHHIIGNRLPNITENIGVPSTLEVDITEFVTFTIVRNPFDRFISLFAYCQTAPLQNNFNKYRWDALSSDQHRALPKNRLQRSSYWPDDVSNFIYQLRHHKSYYNDFVGEKYLTMTRWLGNYPLDFVGRYENLNADFNEICNLLEIGPVELERVNDSITKFKLEALKTIVLDNSIQNAIIEYFEDDFDFFQYSKDIYECNTYMEFQRHNLI